MKILVIAEFYLGDELINETILNMDSEYDQTYLEISIKEVLNHSHPSVKLKVDKFQLVEETEYFPENPRPLGEVVGYDSLEDA